MEALAIFFLAMLAYVLVGYPLLQFVLAKLRPAGVETDDEPRPLSVIICVRDEERQISKRLDNLVSMEYPRELVQIIVVSDGSVDATDDIVRSRAGDGVELVRLPVPSGKAVALNAGVAVAKHDLLLFGDARQSFAPDVARRLVSHFADPRVGGVSGRLVIAPDEGEGAAVGVGAYWDYEVRLRTAEAATDSAMGATGAIYALRRECFRTVPEGTILDDLLVPMRAVMDGYRVLYDPDAVAVDRKPVHDRGELARKVRTLYGNLQLMRLAPELFSPLRNRLWFRFVSHKMLRLFLPLFFAGSLVFCLLAGGVFTLFGMIQLACWLMACIAYATSSGSLPGRILSALLLLNAAVVLAWHRFLSGRDDVWTAASSNQQAPPGAEKAR